MKDFTREETYALSVHAPRHARHALDRYSDLMEGALLDDLRIITTELVSNAVRHSGRPDGDPIMVTTGLATGVMRVDVIDQGTNAVTFRPRSSGLRSGLEIVALISDRWSGITSVPHVWAEIDVLVNGHLKRQGTGNA